MRKLFLSAAILALAAGPALAQPAPPMGPHEWGPKEHEMRMRMMMMQQGDLFRFKRGKEEVEIRCTSEQPVQTCVEAATRLMQQLSNMKHGEDHGENQGAGGTSSSNESTSSGSGH